MLKLSERNITVKPLDPQASPLSEADSHMLQAHMEALILTMDRLGVSHVELQAKNIAKSGGKFTLLPLNE
jgi:hypothetical protein